MLFYLLPPRQKCPTVSVGIRATLADSVVFGCVVLHCVVLVENIKSVILMYHQCLVEMPYIPSTS